MVIELTQSHVGGMIERAFELAVASNVEYKRLRSAFGDVTDDSIRAMIPRIQKTRGSDLTRDETVVFFCAVYEMTQERTGQIVAALQNGQGDGTLVHELLVCTSGLFRWLTGLAMLLNGAPLAPSFVDDEVARLRTKNAQKGGEAKAAGLERLKEETIRLFEEGRHANNWKTAVAAAAAITPKIVELSGRLYPTRPLTKTTDKPLEWIREHLRKEPSA